MTSELKVAKVASPIEKEAVLFDEGIRITGGDYPIVVNTLAEAEALATRLADGRKITVVSDSSSTPPGLTRHFTTLVGDLSVPTPVLAESIQAEGGVSLQDKLDEIVAGAATQIQIDNSIAAHNENADAHPALAALFANDAAAAEAAKIQAEAARDQTSGFASFAAANVAFQTNRGFTAAAASTANTTATYNNGAGTLTGAGALGAQDGVTLAVGHNLLVKDQTNQFENGWYTLTTLSPFVLTRHVLANTDPTLSGSCTQITGGTLYTGWSFANQQSSITLGTTAVTFLGRPASVGALTGQVTPLTKLTFNDTYNYSVGAGGTTEFNNGTYLVQRVTRRGRITAMDVNIASLRGGSLTLVVARAVQAPNRFDDVVRATSTRILGNNTILDPFGDVTVEVGDWIGFVCAVNTAALSYAGSGGPGSYFFNAATTALDDVSFTANVSARDYQLAATIMGVEIDDSQFSQETLARFLSMEVNQSLNIQRLDALNAPKGKRTYRKTALSLGDLSTAQGVAVHGSGGLTAAVDGVAGSATIALPFDLDNTKPWQFTLTFVIGAGANNTTFKLRDSVNTSHAGIAATSIKANNISTQYGFSVFLNQAGFPDVVAGTTVWFSVTCDGLGTISQSMQTSILTGAGGGITTGAFQDSTNKLFARVDPDTHIYTGSIPTFGSSAGYLNALELTLANADTRLTGVYASVGGYESYTDGTGTPAVVGINKDQHILKSSANAFSNPSEVPFLVLPRFRPSTDKPVVFQMHPNEVKSAINTGANGATLLGLYLKGYAIGLIQGMYNSGFNATVGKGYANPTSSNWAGRTGMEYRYGFMDWITRYWNFDKYCLYGESMGLLTSLTHLTDERKRPFCIVGISGVTDLTASFALAAFTAIIQRGHGDWYVSLVGSNTETPSLTATNWKRIGNRSVPPSAAYFDAPYIWKDAWAAGTYAANDIVVIPFAGTSTALKDRDPSLNVSLFVKTPIYLRHGTSDTIIPSSQASNFQTAVNNAGGDVTVDLVGGAGHLTGCYSGAAEIAFIESCR